MKLFNIFNILLLTTTIIAKQAELVDITAVDPTIQIDLVFATGNNPIIDIPVIMYPAGTKCYICKEAAYKLKEVQRELNTLGLGLKIRDAFRPMWAQKRLWHEVQTLQLPRPDDYISDPVVEGGRHTRGTAVDLTIINLTSGQEIPLPPFCFAEVAHRDYEGPLLTAEQINNKKFLQSLMIKHGFSTIKAEWWHFDVTGWQEYEPLTVSFAEIQ